MTANLVEFSKNIITKWKFYKILTMIYVRMNNYFLKHFNTS